MGGNSRHDICCFHALSPLTGICDTIRVSDVCNLVQELFDTINPLALSALTYFLFKHTKQIVERLR
jgi:hypothetical protein